MARQDWMWTAVSAGGSALAGVGARKIVTQLRRDESGETSSLPNPADRRVDWTEALRWAVLAAVAGGVMRVIAIRLAASSWERLAGSEPPGLRTD